VSEWASAAIHSRRHVVDGVITIDFACCLSTSNVCCPQQTYASPAVINGQPTEKSAKKRGRRRRIILDYITDIRVYIIKFKVPR
jgi:hypothetical protein